jgi:hypothetical protein
MQEQLSESSGDSISTTPKQSGSLDDGVDEMSSGNFDLEEIPEENTVDQGDDGSSIHDMQQQLSESSGDDTSIESSEEAMTSGQDDISETSEQSGSSDEVIDDESISSSEAEGVDEGAEDVVEEGGVDEGAEDVVEEGGVDEGAEDVVDDEEM